MTLWTIQYSEQARQDLHYINLYISVNLYSPSADNKQIIQIINKIDALTSFPYRHQLYPDEPWHSIGLRYFPVNNYIIFYHPNKENKVVEIVRIMYNRQDIKNHLSNSELK